MVTADELSARRLEIAESADLQKLLAGLMERARPVLEGSHQR